MPLYEYTCQDCGLRFDAFRAMKDADVSISCKNCFSINTRRALSVFYASSEGRTITASGGGCAGCSGGSCSSCGH
jgi:putative FmdB family regulatory protein